MAEIQQLTKDEFDGKVIESSLPVLVDFWADWCAPCKMVAPVVEAIAEKYEGRLAVGKVDVDQEQDLAGRFAIRSIPTLLLFKDGEVAETFIGYMPEETLTAKLDEAL
ncbi:MAG: thioredoxin [Armatimonadota bacterium]